MVKNYESIEPNSMAKFLYATYRILWENTATSNLIKELKGINKNFLNDVRSFSWKKNLENKDESEKFSICNAVPSFMVNHLNNFMDFEFMAENISAMNGLIGNTDVSIRINNLIGDFTKEDLYLKIKESLEQSNIDFYQDQHLPELINVHLNSKNNILNNYWYKRGYLIFQNKASAAVVQTLSPKKTDLIFDMCAAPGIKTSQIAQYMENEGHLIAGEFLGSRMEMLEKILRDLNVLNCFLINIDSIDPPFRFENQFDRILLDAPCTGSGTFLKSPELKWRQSENFLHQNTVLQKKLLKSAIKLLKPDGILVYSTCSLYPEEGEFQILDNLDKLQPLPLPSWFSPSYEIEDSILPGTGRLFPSTHQTQGFFIGKFKKKQQ